MKVNVSFQINAKNKITGMLRFSFIKHNFSFTRFIRGMQKNNIPIASYLKFIQFMILDLL